MTGSRRTITLSLISHTNVGKTTLARTLLQREVGEVLDQAHVTEQAEAYDLIETPGAVLRLWDTPGFGDLTRLVKRLRTENEPLGWFLRQVWDRLLNRPLWCSQQAARNVRDEADVVLYLVNASEDPGEAGYVPPELELLTWMNRPVIVLLNQIGEAASGGAGKPGDVVKRWVEFSRQWPIIRDVLSLDAFTRCWIEESVLLERVVKVLEGDRRDAMQALADAWDARNLALYRESCGLMTDYLLRAACDRAAPDSGGDAGEAPKDPGVVEDVARLLRMTPPDRKRAMAALNERLDHATARLMERLIEGHGLVGESATRIENSIREFQLQGSTPISDRTGAIAGAVVSGALSGLAADALSGGLTLGGGLIAGGILGALGGVALARGYRLVGGREKPSVSWAPPFLTQLVRQVILRYLAVAHFGRGRGPYRDLERPARWSEAVDRALGARDRELQRIWERCAAGGSEGAEDPKCRADLEAVVDAVLREVLAEAYPQARRLLA